MTAILSILAAVLSLPPSLPRAPIAVPPAPGRAEAARLATRLSCSKASTAADGRSSALITNLGPDAVSPSDVVALDVHLIGSGATAHHELSAPAGIAVHGTFFVMPADIRWDTCTATVRRS